MKRKLIEHALSVLLVTVVAAEIVAAIGERETTLRTAHAKSVEQYLQLDFIDFGDPLHRALFKETLDLFYPERLAANDSLLRAIERFRQEQFTSQEYKTGREERGLSGPRLVTLGGIYLQFIIIYLIVMVVSYHAAQSLAIFRFIRMKQNRKPYLVELYEHIRGPHRGNSLFSFRLPLVLLKPLVKGVAYAILFSPAYVIAYSIRSGFDTNSHLFMVVLGVVSNGLLIGSTNKFYTFLVTESRKGYVQTAIVKNLHASYAWGSADGISYKSVLRPKSLFPSHVFRHIYLNARFQYLPALKEHASFLITGLIIIEMALNIQGHLGYELMQNILYKQYDVALTVVVGIFLIVKATEISVDVWFHRESAQYENKG